MTPGMDIAEFNDKIYDFYDYLLINLYRPSEIQSDDVWATICYCLALDQFNTAVTENGEVKFCVK